MELRERMHSRRLARSVRYLFVHEDQLGEINALVDQCVARFS